jgi:hypothetical protein
MTKAVRCEEACICANCSTKWRPAGLENKLSAHSSSQQLSPSGAEYAMSHGLYSKTPVLMLNRSQNQNRVSAIAEESFHTV